MWQGPRESATLNDIAKRMRRVCEVAHTQTGKFELNPAYAEMAGQRLAA
jgi:hypothetical protein